MSGGNNGLPRNPDAERFLLGSILLDYATHGHILDQIGPNDFPVEKDRQIVRAMVHLHATGEAIDRVTVANELKNRGQLEVVGVTYLYSLDDGIPLVPNVDSYLGLVKEKTSLRQIMNQG